MAAKQGLTAHISQASEDAKRAVLSRAPTAIASHSWLSNLNTTCTIKSAPPRTPEVMTLLSTRSGWLVKRNEQQVWQRRWCCVVPHTFLYYFEAEPMRDDGDDGYNDVATTYNRRGSLIVENQDLLNAAVRDGCKGKYNDMSPLKGRDTNALYSPQSGEKVTPANVRGPTTSNGNLSPAGIIDLECYTCVNRSSRNELVFELTGDEKTNPDLRSFYFQAGSIDDCEMWTNALLSDRHSALRDEREAYRQVCDSFQLQLQNMSDMIDEAEGKASEAESMLYNVRSASEKFRIQIVTIVREALEQKCWESVKTNEDELKNESKKIEEHLEKSRLFYLDQIDAVVSSENIGTTKNTGALITQVLVDYLAIVVGSFTEIGVEMKSMEQKLNRSAGVDKAAVNDLKLKIQQLEAEKEEMKQQHDSSMSKISSQLIDLQKSNEELEDQLQTQRVEFSMFQSQAKSKLQELSQHKKILKREVIDLRKRIDEVGSERDAALHITDSHKLLADTEKERNAMLEKYIEKMENQVAVQQNMMEMMSLSGMSHSGMSHVDESGASRSNSVVGRIIAAPDDSSYSSFGPRHFRTTNVRDASPYRLPPKSKVPSGENPPLSPKARKRNEDIPKSPKSSKSSKSKKKSKTPQKPPSIHRGTLDHEFLGHQNDKQELNKKNNRDDSKNDSTDDDDNRSNVSELTEDRTHREYQTKLQERETAIQYTMSDMTGENVIDGVPSKNLLLSQSVQEANAFPPRYIIGAPQSDMNDERDDNFSSKSNAESINANGTALSTAQKARLAAELNGNKVDVTLEAETIRLREAKEREQKLASPLNKTRSESPGMFSNLASMIAKRKDAKSLSGVSDTNSNVGSQNSEVTMTLAERMQQQKERQLRVLREQGLLKEGEESIIGGPGAQAMRSNSNQKQR